MQINRRKPPRQLKSKFPIYFDEKKACFYGISRSKSRENGVGEAVK